jgi:prepilin-type N-terminal cleavage/methylation domain-containing protein
LTARGDEGFTLAEVVIALAVVSIALAGILAATNLVTRHNRQVTKWQKASSASDQTVARLRIELARGQPFDTENFTGSATQIDFDCGDGRRCRYRLPSGDQRFAYVTHGDILPFWPRKPAVPDTPERLEALILQDRSGTTLGLVRLETEQTENCQFDMISRTCHGEGRDTP